MATTQSSLPLFRGFETSPKYLEHESEGAAVFQRASTLDEMEWEQLKIVLFVWKIWIAQKAF